MQKTVFILLFSLLLVPLTYADMGPKPSLEVSVSFEGKPIDGLFAAAVLYCFGPEQRSIYPYPDEEILENKLVEMQDGSDLGQIKKYGLTPKQMAILEKDGNCYWIPAEYSWGGDCSNSKCNFGYGIPDSFRLAVYLPSRQKVFFTNEAPRTNKGLDTYLQADLKQDGTGVLSESPSNPFNTVFSARRFFAIALALVITLIIECALALIYFAIRRKNLRNVKGVVAANVVSLPSLWIFLAITPLGFLNSIAIAEIGIVFLEGAIIRKLSNGDLSLPHATILSAVLNACSFLFGTIMPLFMVGY